MGGRQLFLAVIAVVAAVVLAGTGQRPARADWQSLSGGFLPAHVSNVNFIISPNSAYVAYVTDAITDDVDELFVVPTAGGTPLKLNPPLVAGGDVNNSTSRIAFTPDSQAIIYLADQEVDNRVELYRVAVTGGTPVKLNAALVAGGNVISFLIYNDGANSRITYVADQQTNEVFELWSISLTGGGLFKLSGTLVAGGDVGTVQHDTIGNRAVFSADAETDGKYELYSTPIAGGTRVKLNDPITLQGGGDAGIYSEFAVNPAIQVVVFVQRTAAAPGGMVVQIPTAGGVPTTQLSFNLLSTQRILNFRVSPVGDRVVYNVGTRDGTTNAFDGNLYSVLIGGGGAADLTEPADPLFGVDLFQFTPDGSRVVYLYQKNAAAVPRLESSNVTSAARATVHQPVTGGPPLSTFRLSGDSQWVLYQTDLNSNEYPTFIVPIGGGSPVSFGMSNFPVIFPDSSRIAYTELSGPNNNAELMSAQIFGGGVRNLSGMDNAGFIGEVKISPNSQRIVFIVQQNSRYDLRVSDGLPAQPSPTATGTATATSTATVTPVPSATTGPSADPAARQSIPAAFVARPVQ